MLHPRLRLRWLCTERRSAEGSRVLTSTDHRRATAIDGSPVIDVKPYATEFNPAGPVREPASMRELMREYY